MIDTTTVMKAARLARLQLEEEQVTRLTSELSRILEHVQTLEELDVSDVPPLTHATGGSDVYREDEVGPVLSPDAALENAPDRDGDLFRVPPVIGDG